MVRIILTTLFSVLLSLNASAQMACPEALPTEVLSTAQETNLVSAFDVAKTNWIEKLQQFKKQNDAKDAEAFDNDVANAFDPQQFKSDTEKLAFLEAYAFVSGRNFLALAKKAEAREITDKVMLKILGKLKTNEPISSLQIMKFLEKAYDLVNKPPSRWKRFWGPGMSELRNRKRDIELAHRDLTGILDSLGILRERSDWEGFRWWYRSARHYFSTGFFVGMDVLLWPVFRWPLFTPSFRFSLPLDSADRTVEQIEDISWARKFGIFTEYGQRKVQMALTGYMVYLALAAASSMHWDFGKMSHEAVEFTQVSIAEIKAFWDPVTALLRANEPPPPINDFLKQTIDSDTYRIWAASFKQQYGYVPDPINDMNDRLQWAAKVNQITGGKNGS